MLHICAQHDVWFLCANLYDLFLPSCGQWEKVEKSTQHVYEKGIDGSPVLGIF